MDIQQRNDEGLRELALFAGAGGGILGGKLLGWKTVCAVEWDAYARDVLVARQNDGCLPAFPIWDDVCTFDGRPWRGRIDVISGGFPCQDISCAGKGAGIEGERSSMWKHMARIIGEVRPRYAFVENSPMLVGRGLSTVLSDLAEMGYDAKWGIVGAHHVSAPHRRDRIWIIAADSNVRRCNDGSDSERQYEANYAQVGQTAEDQQSGSIGQHRISENGCDVANADLSHEQRTRQPIRSNQEYAKFDSSSTWWRQDPAETPKSNVGRVAHGVASRVDRLKCIGNGQVPQVAALAWKLLSR
jgi:DNA (cytosine-5)-methyltransferase 1